MTRVRVNQPGIVGRNAAPINLGPNPILQPFNAFDEFQHGVDTRNRNTINEQGIERNAFTMGQTQRDDARREETFGALQNAMTEEDIFNALNMSDPGLANQYRQDIARMSADERAANLAEINGLIPQFSGQTPETQQGLFNAANQDTQGRFGERFPGGVQDPQLQAQVTANAPQTSNEPLQTIIGDDGNPTLVRRSDAVGQTPGKVGSAEDEFNLLSAELAVQKGQAGLLADADERAATQDAANEKQRILVGSIDNVLATVSQAELETNALTTGIAGMIIGAIPGTPAYNLQAKVLSIQ